MNEVGGRKGSSGHQNLVRLASLKLLNEVLGDNFLQVTFVRENPLDVKTQSTVEGSGFGSTRIATAEVRLYADVACAVVYDPNSEWALKKDTDPELIKIVDKFFAEGKMAEYRHAVRDTYGMMFYMIECEINPSSNLLRDGPRLTAYKLIKQQNNNLKLILAVFEGTKVDNPDIFDAIWNFPKKEE
jgi:hypothetical protein